MEPGPVDQHVGQNLLAPGRLSCEIKTKPVGLTKRAEANCNIQCYSHPECVAFVMGRDGKGRVKCYMKRCAVPLAPSPGANSSLLTVNGLQEKSEKCANSATREAIRAIREAKTKEQVK